MTDSSCPHTTSDMASVARNLAKWAHSYKPNAADLALADRALKDTVAVALAARQHPLKQIVSGLPPAARWAAMSHVLDFDDLHIETTTHISVVTVPATLAAEGDARAYLAGAGVFARLAEGFGWNHYANGWHITCTAGAPAAAVAAGIARGLSEEQLATAIALAVPAAGGVQEAFGTHGKSLQVGFAADAGVRAADLAARGATAATAAVESWMNKLGGSPANVGAQTTPAVPGGLAIKMFPCCYAMQRPIAAIRDLKPIEHDKLTKIVARTPAGVIHPLIYDFPETGLAGKFSLQYSIATALLDEYPGFESFTDRMVQRPEAQALMRKVEVQKEDTPIENLLDDKINLELHYQDGTVTKTSLELPPGAPRRPPTEEQLEEKLKSCGDDVPGLMKGISWADGTRLMKDAF